MSTRELCQWNYLPDSMPPESRNVLLAIAHHAEPILMRKFATGSWHTVDDKSEWIVDGMDRNFNEWGWYLVAWMPLPEFPEVL